MAVIILCVCQRNYDWFRISYASRETSLKYVMYTRWNFWMHGTRQPWSYLTRYLKGCEVLTTDDTNTDLTVHSLKWSIHVTWFLNTSLFTSAWSHLYSLLPVVRTFTIWQWNLQPFQSSRSAKLRNTISTLHLHSASHTLCFQKHAWDLRLRECMSCKSIAAI